MTHNKINKIIFESLVVGLMLNKVLGIVICLAITAVFNGAEASFFRWFGFGTDDTNVMINSTHDNHPPCPPPHKQPPKHKPKKHKHKPKPKHEKHPQPPHTNCFWWWCK